MLVDFLFFVEGNLIKLWYIILPRSFISAFRSGLNSGFSSGFSSEYTKYLKLWGENNRRSRLGVIGSGETSFCDIADRHAQ
ncbi:MAG: hypothetical protein COA42_08015 [Alteromonadaceae bacterium]|nr:MAG: hypothetical protein COA42_08015 [Alteromonadaceae bacterium]